LVILFLASFLDGDRLFSIPLDLVKYTQPASLILYAMVGLICAGVSIGYVKIFYIISDYFSKIRIPKYLKPAIGGVLVGMIGIVFPQILGSSYGWLQIAIDKDYALLPLYILGPVFVFKILATSLTIGSGGSAGVFGPSMVIGGFLEAFIGTVFHLFGLFTLDRCYFGNHSCNGIIFRCYSKNANLINNNGK
jgi:chloride channel protein, CIC family